MRAVAVATVLGLALAVRASSDESKDIRTAYAKFGFALAAKDLAGIRALEAPGFTTTQNGKKLTAKQFGALLKREFAGLSRIGYFRVQNQSIKDSGAQVDLSGQFWFHAQLPAAGGARPAPLDIHGTIATVLVKAGAGYQFKSMDQKVDVTAVAGKRQGPAPNAYGLTP